MASKKRNNDFDREKKIKKIKDKNVLDKHRKLIYNIASAKVMQNDYEDDDELEYAYVIDAKTKRR